MNLCHVGRLVGVPKKGREVPLPCSYLITFNHSPFKVDAEAPVRREEPALDVVEVVVVLEQQADPVRVPVGQSIHMRKQERRIL